MKFSIAAGILAQTLPAISEEQVSNLLSTTFSRHGDPTSFLDPSQQEERHVQSSSKRSGRFMQALARRGVLKNAPSVSTEVKECDPTSNDADVGILSCGRGSDCLADEASLLGGKCVSNDSSSSFKKKLFAGLLKNKAAEPMAVDAQECDPTADIGLLACESDQHVCIENAASSLGGFCTSTLRHLNHLGENADACTPGSIYYDVAEECDCSGFSNVTGDGVVPCVYFSDFCLGDVYRGCDDTCITRTVEYTLSNFTSTSYTSCFEFPRSPYPQKVCLEEDLVGNTCTLEFNDVACGSCEIVPYEDYSYVAFDCTNAGGREGTTIYGLVDLIPVIDECFVSFCDLCGDGYIVSDESLDTVIGEGFEGTCGDLYNAAYNNVTIGVDTCPSAGLIASDSGCCAPIPYVDCSICGNGTLLEDVSFDFLGYTLTCGEVQPLLNISYYCDYYTPSIAGTCCAAETDAPTASPIALPTAANINPPTPSTASTTRAWSTTKVVSAMGVAAVTINTLLN